MRENNISFYGISTLFWLLAGVASYFLYSFWENKNSLEESILYSSNRIYQLHKESFEREEEYRYRANASQFSQMLSTRNPFDEKVLDSIVIVKNVLDSLEKVNAISFEDVASYFLKRDFTNYNDTRKLVNIVNKNEACRNTLHCNLYKNILLNSLRSNRDDRFDQLGYYLHSSLYKLRIQLFNENKVGLASSYSDYNIVYAIHPLDGTGYLTTKSSSFEFEVIVKKLGRKPEMITTKYRTIPQEDGSLGTFDYEQVEGY